MILIVVVVGVVVTVAVVAVLIKRSRKGKIMTVAPSTGRTLSSDELNLSDVTDDELDGLEGRLSRRVSTGSYRSARTNDRVPAGSRAGPNAWSELVQDFWWDENSPGLNKPRKSLIGEDLDSGRRLNKRTLKNDTSQRKFDHDQLWSDL